MIIDNDTKRLIAGKSSFRSDFQQSETSLKKVSDNLLRRICYLSAMKRANSQKQKMWWKRIPWQKTLEVGNVKGERMPRSKKKKNNCAVIIGSMVPAIAQKKRKIKKATWTKQEAYKRKKNENFIELWRS